MSGLGILAGESRDQYVSRIESELVGALDRIDELEGEVDAERCAKSPGVASEEDLEALAFLREQLTELALQIRSPSAPTKPSQMKRLIEGMLRGEDWRHGTWR